MNNYNLSQHVLHIAGAPAGGIRRHIHAILFGLKDTRQSYACSFSDGDSLFHRELPLLERTLDGRVLRLNVKKRPAFSDFSNLLRLRAFVIKNNVTIVHGHGAKGGAYARLLKTLCDVKSVYTPHGGAVHAMFSMPEEAVYRNVEKFLSRKTDFFVFESEYSRRAYVAKVGWEPANQVVNYSGIGLPDVARLDGEVLALGYPPPPRMVPEVGVFGVLRSQKGQGVALAAVDILRRRGINIRLNIFGAGPDYARLVSAVEKAGIARLVRFHGEVINAPAHMRAMDIVLIPSLFESFGYVAIEAFSLRKPVIAAATGGLKEIVRHGEDGLLFEPGSPRAIADACQSLIQNPPLRAAFTEKGYSKYVSEFSEAKMIERLSKVYSRL